MIGAAVRILAHARRPLVITGAGMSADSGLPTYRGVGGLYDDAATEDGIPIETALSGSMFAARPDLTWKDIAQLEQAYRDAEHNRGHEVLALMEARYERLCVLTQNVDGFHKDAGSTDVIEIHGEIRKLYCIACEYRREVRNYAALDVPPICPRCGAIIRPDVVLFGEVLDTERVARMQAAIDGTDVVVSIGTSALFPYIVDPVLRAKAAGIPTIEINPALTEISDLVDVKIAAGAAETLDRIWSELTASR